MAMTEQQSPKFDALLSALADRATSAQVFGQVTLADGVLTCTAAASAEPASYRVELDGGRIWVSLVTKDRWLSESIESELMHTGDKLEELLEEEMVDLGYTGEPLGFEHFRSEDLHFTFRSAVPVALDAIDGSASDTLALCLLGYEACFRQLGDMNADAEEDD